MTYNFSLSFSMLFKSFCVQRIIGKCTSGHLFPCGGFNPPFWIPLLVSGRYDTAHHFGKLNLNSTFQSEEASHKRR